MSREKFIVTIKKDARKNYSLYLMMLPILAFYILFHYGPMYGLAIAFQDWRIGAAGGFLSGPWVGFDNFIRFFNSFHFERVIRNTLWISFAEIVFGFPAPIILALLINELKSKTFSRVTQTITYLPHFISLVVVAGMVVTFTNDTGFISQIFAAITGNEPVSMLQWANYFVPILVTMNIWRFMGWTSIIYVAALAGIDPSLYEAAVIDGASKFKRLLHITLPCLMPTVIIMLILRLGQVMNVGFEPVILLQNDMNLASSDVIQSLVFREGIMTAGNESYTTAIGFFNSAINLGFIIVANFISSKVTGTSLW